MQLPIINSSLVCLLLLHTAGAVRLLDEPKSFVRGPSAFHSGQTVPNDLTVLLAAAAAAPRCYTDPS